VQCCDNDDMALKCLELTNRQDLDFTEQLWNILRGEQSVAYTEIIQTVTRLLLF